MGGVAKKEFGQATIIGGTDDHIHGLLFLRPRVSVSKAMERWKSLATIWVKKTVSDTNDFRWQRGYSAFSVSRSQAEKVVVYIARQDEHRRVMTFAEEFARLLEAHGIELPGASD